MCYWLVAYSTVKNSHVRVPRDGKSPSNATVVCESQNIESVGNSFHTLIHILRIWYCVCGVVWVMLRMWYYVNSITYVVLPV